MQDIPFFTTENGAASLILKEIPARHRAYVRILDSLSPRELIEECISFCRAVDAESVFATGHVFLESYPLHTVILEMQADLNTIPDTNAALFPVQDKTIDQWCKIYNERMRDVDNSAYMSRRDGTALVKAGNGYFVHNNGTLLGIGIASGDKIDAVASVLPGAGKDVVAALAHALSDETVHLEVASTNFRAMRLYADLGFITVREISRWYKIF